MITNISAENLNELENMAVSSFKNVVDKDVKKLRYPFKHHPWGPEQLKNKICIKPLMAPDMKILRLKFPVPNVSECDATVSYT